MKKFRILFTVVVVLTLLVLTLIRTGIISLTPTPKTLQAYVKQFGVPENGVIRRVEEEHFLFISPGFDTMFVATNILKAPLFIYNPKGELAAYKIPDDANIRFVDTNSFAKAEYRKATDPIQLLYLFPELSQLSATGFQERLSPILSGAEKPFKYRAEIHLVHTRYSNIKIRQRIAKALRDEHCYYLQQTIDKDLITFIKENDSTRLKMLCQKGIDVIKTSNNEHRQIIKEALVRDSISLQKTNKALNDIEEKLKAKMKNEKISKAEPLMTERLRIKQEMSALEDSLIVKRILLGSNTPTFQLIAPATIIEIE